MPSILNNALTVAIDAALAAEAVILKYYSQSLKVSYKADDSPVTEADIAAEKTIRQRLTAAFPDFGFYGEETGSSNTDAEYLWLVDPIDGTKSFVRKMPFFSTQIALMHQNQVVLGVSNAPANQEMVSAVLGQGSHDYRDSTVGMASRLSTKNTIKDPLMAALSTSQIREYSGAFLSTGNLKSLASDNDRWHRLAKVFQSVARIRGYGDYGHYHQLARGQADLVIESDVNILDIAALSLIVTEAGGVFTDLNGQAITLETTSVLAASTPELHSIALADLS